MSSAIGHAEKLVEKLAAVLADERRKESTAVNALKEARAAVARGKSWEQVNVLNRAKVTEGHKMVWSPRSAEYDALKYVSEGVQMVASHIIQSAMKYSDRRRAKGSNALFRLVHAHAAKAATAPATRRFTQLAWARDVKSALEEGIRREANRAIKWMDDEEKKVNRPTPTPTLARTRTLTLTLSLPRTLTLR